MKLLLSLLVLLFSSIAATAQIQLEDFYKEGSSWCEVERPWHDKYEPDLIRFHTWTIVEDSLINQQTYHLVTFSAHDNLNNTVYRNEIVGGVRVSGDSVYFIRLYTFNWTGHYPGRVIEGTFNYLPLNQEVLLYRYDLKIGDSVNHDLINYAVIEMDSISTSNVKMLPRYKLEYPSLSYYYWIRGIGANCGFMGRYVPDKVYSRLSAYFNPNFYYLTYIYPYYPTDCFPLSVESTNKIKNALSIYPNPLLHNTLHITSPGIEKLSIIDMTGKVVYAVTAIPPSDQTVTVDLLAGIYILKAQLADGTSEVRKIIKQ